MSRVFLDKETDFIWCSFLPPFDSELPPAELRKMLVKDSLRRKIIQRSGIKIHIIMAKGSTPDQLVPYFRFHFLKRKIQLKLPKCALWAEETPAKKELKGAGKLGNHPTLNSLMHITTNGHAAGIAEKLEHQEKR